jgi:hypothetical protein
MEIASWRRYGSDYRGDHYAGYGYDCWILDMSKFLAPLDARIGRRKRGGKFVRICQLQRDLFYQSDLLRKTIRIPVGFISDGASVPRLMWSIYPPFGRYLEAAVVHDYYCELGRMGKSPIDSVAAAKLFLEAMEVCGVSKWKRTKMYWAVRLGGPKFNARLRLKNNSKIN